jgi:hypothetical protein
VGVHGAQANPTIIIGWGHNPLWAVSKKKPTGNGTMSADKLFVQFVDAVAQEAFLVKFPDTIDKAPLNILFVGSWRRLCFIKVFDLANLSW